jgi:serine/threonine-protein kinase
MSQPTSPLEPQVVDPDLETGQVVGEYQVEGKLGQGGFGAVFKAVHPLIGKVVAIKVLARKFSVDPQMVSRFIAEAKAVNQIRHRNIIDIFSFGQLSDGRHYYVMEYLDGEPLDKLLDRDGKLSLVEALPILRAIARALDAAHAKGIAHRDLKPENVFVARDPDGGYFPKLLDFGIAKLMAGEDAGKHKTRTGMPIGTPYFMSPEQCRGKDVDHRTDYYAFGVVAYKLLTGVYPFDADDFMSIMIKQINDEPPPPSSLDPELPAGIDDGIAWLMRKDPGARPPSLITAVQALESAAENSGFAIPRAPISAPISAVVPAQRSTVARTGIAVAATMPPGLPVASVDDRAAPASRGSIGALIAAMFGVLVVGAGVFYFVTRSTSEPSPDPEGASPTAAIAPAPTSVPSPSPSDPRPPPVAAPPVAAPPVAAPPVAAPPVAAPPAQAPQAETHAIDAAPPTVTITIVGVPAGTDVVLGDSRLGAAPGPISVPRNAAAIELVLRHAGYVSAKHKVVPDHDQSFKMSLKHVATAPAPSRPTEPTPPGGADSHDIEDPFHR